MQVFSVLQLQIPADRGTRLADAIVRLATCTHRQPRQFHMHVLCRQRFEQRVLQAALEPTRAVTPGLIGTLSGSGPKQRKLERVALSRRNGMGFR